MKSALDRREFLNLMGMGGVVFVAGLGYPAIAAQKGNTQEDFFFVQLSDTHWGFTGPTVNPDAGGTLKKAVEAVNSLKHRPDFIVFTGDLTHTTDDSQERRKRMAQFRDIVSRLKVKDIRFMPGEHDASLDDGKAFQELFGKTHYTFQHKGVHFIVLDNVSDPTASIGQTQLEWLVTQMKGLRNDSRIVVFTHRPLFDLYPQWDWATRDGAKVLELLKPYHDVTVFYGHIHQEHHFKTDHISHHAAKGLMFALPAPGSVPQRARIPWDPAMPYKGLGFRSVEVEVKRADYRIAEFPVTKG